MAAPLRGESGPPTSCAALLPHLDGSKAPISEACVDRLADLRRLERADVAPAVARFHQCGGQQAPGEPASADLGQSGDEDHARIALAVDDPEHACIAGDVQTEVVV